MSCEPVLPQDLACRRSHERQRQGQEGEKVKPRTRRARKTKAMGKAGSTEPRTALKKKCCYCDRTGHMKSDCQQRAGDVRKATSAKKVSTLQTRDETPPVASLTLAPDFRWLLLRNHDEQAAWENQTMEHHGENDVLFTTAGHKSIGVIFQVCSVRSPIVSVHHLIQAVCSLEVNDSMAQLRITEKEHWYWPQLVMLSSWICRIVDLLFTTQTR